MATKRIFSKDIIDTDKFLDLPFNSQLLYFHLGLQADAKGFVEPKKVVRLVGLKNEDLKPLISSRLILIFKSGVIVITDWNIHNNIRLDREAPSQYVEECNLLMLSEQGKYQLQEYYRSTTGELPHKVTESKVTESKEKKEEVSPSKTYWKASYGEQYISAFNKLFSTKYRLTPARIEKLKLRFKTYTPEEISKALINLSESKFHQGENDRSWRANPDFLIRSDEKVDEWLNYEEGGDENG